VLPFNQSITLYNVRLLATIYKIYNLENTTTNKYFFYFKARTHTHSLTHDGDAALHFAAAGDGACVPVPLIKKKTKDRTVVQ